MRRERTTTAGIRFAIGLMVALQGVESSPGQTATWPRFRGPNGLGVAEGARLPETWTVEDFEWTAELSGSGTSSPVVWGDRLWVTSCESESARVWLECYEVATGRRVWRRSFDGQPYRMHGRNSYAASTPCLDEDRIYLAYADLQHTWLVAVDHEGEEVWRRDFGAWVSAHGFAASPIVYQDLVLFHLSQQGDRLRPGQTPGHSRMIAVDRRTGEDVWRTDLKTTIASYSVPGIDSRGDHDQIVGCSSGEGFFGIDPTNGKLLWEQPVFQLRTVASPVLVDGRLLGTNGTGGGGNYLVAVDLEQEPPKEMFRFRSSVNYVSTLVAFDSLVFLCGDKGIVSCLDLETGQRHWRKRMARGFSASPIVVGKSVCAVDEEGRVLVFPATRESPEPQVVALGEPTRATPAVAGERILFRTRQHLYCLLGERVDP